MTVTDAGMGRVDSFLTGFFAMALIVAALGTGYELGVALAGSAVDPALLIATGGGAIASAVGLWRVQCAE